MTNKNFKNEKINNNGFGYIDLELPSGTLWATCNVGAKRPSDFGLYFQWGDTKGYAKEQIGQENQFNWNSYKWNPNGDGKTSTKYTTNSATLELEDDAANANMGGGWHIPTPAQIQELLDNTTTAWTTLDGVSGVTFTSKNDTSKYIFIPAAGCALDGEITLDGECGCVWGSTTDLENIIFAKNLCIDYHNARLCFCWRCFGSPIRGVIG